MVLKPGRCGPVSRHRFAHPLYRPQANRPPFEVHVGDLTVLVLRIQRSAVRWRHELGRRCNLPPGAVGSAPGVGLEAAGAVIPRRESPPEPPSHPV